MRRKRGGEHAVLERGGADVGGVGEADARAGRQTRAGR
jgi:hypothetical protein